MKHSAYLKEIDFFAHDFNVSREIWVEIGFGSGRHLLHQAKKHPEIQFIGLEIHKPSIEQVLKQCELQGISNILVVDYDARLFMEFLASNVVGRILVHFPVPWDKKPHRRVFSAAFIEEALRVLRPNGTLELRTDSQLYFEFSFSQMMQLTQAIGRCRRTKDGKEDCVIYDYRFPNVVIAKNHGKVRDKVYKENGFTVIGKEATKRRKTGRGWGVFRR